MDSRIRNPRLARLLLLTAALLVAALVAEVGLRLAGYDEKHFNPLNSFHQPDPLVGYRGKPGFESRFKRPDFDVVIAHDDEGFRRQEHRRPPATPARRLFVFGDSTTWGWGVEQGRVFTDRMSLLMPGYEVSNYGLNGSGTAQQYVLFEHLVKPRLEPGNWVLLLFSANDWDDNVEGHVQAFVDDDGEVRLREPRGFGSPVLDAIGERSYLANLLIYSHNLLRTWAKQRGGARRALADTGAIPADDDQRIPEGSPRHRIAEHLLSAFNEGCVEKAARCVIAPVGMGTQVLELASELGIDTVRIHPALERALAEGRIDGWTLGRDRHWNEQAHRIAAEVLAEFILREDAASR